MNYIKVNRLAGRMGHQLAEWNTSLALSEYYNLKFIHTSLNFGWEQSLNFGKGELNSINVNKIVKLPKFDRADIESIRSNIEGHENTLFLLADGQNLESHWITENRLKDKWKNSPINKPFEEGHNVGIHIRRGDVTKQRYPNRWVSNDEYVRIIKEYVDVDKSKIHIFSEGNPQHFSEFNKFNVRFHLNGNEFETFNKMVKCDTLITGKSGYSYFASIISECDVIAIPFWHAYPDKKRIIKL